MFSSLPSPMVAFPIPPTIFAMSNPTAVEMVVDAMDVVSLRQVTAQRARLDFNRAAGGYNALLFQTPCRCARTSVASIIGVGRL